MTRDRWRVRHAEIPMYLSSVDPAGKPRWTSSASTALRWATCREAQRAAERVGGTAVLIDSDGVEL